MDTKIQKELEQETLSDFHSKMLEDCKSLVRMSRSAMSKNYAKWDHNDHVYNITHLADEQDKKARERKEPEKTTIPITYAQVQTFVSFCFSLFTQRERVFELQGMNQDSHKPAKIGEALLARDLQHNQFETKLNQFLLDVGRFGVGVFKTSWTRETQKAMVEETSPMTSFLGFKMGGKSTVTEQVVTKYLGNKIANISPYRFFPDTRLPLVRFQEGEFCASEDEYSFVALKQMEKQGEIAGTQWLKPMLTKTLEDRGPTRLSDQGGIETPEQKPGQSKGMFLMTEVQRTIIPKDYMVNGKPLGKEDYPVKYLVQYVNDERIVRCEPLNYIHDQFTYDLAEFNPDMHKMVSGSLADTIDPLQSIITWFINSRITSVRKVISNFLVVDPEGIEMKDVADRNPIIRLKPTAAGRGVDKFIKQLEIQDVTARHVDDAKFMQDLVQLTTGINDNILGQFYTGRRSATEARNVNSSAAARLKMLAVIIFYMGLEPMAQKMLSNLRDGLDEETTVKLVGIEGMEDVPGFLKVSKKDLVGSYDLEVFDGTLPSEKGLVAQVLENYLMAFMKNPQAAVALQMDPRAMLLEAMELRGVRNPKRFTLTAPPPQTPAGQPPAGQSPLNPNEQSEPNEGLGSLIAS